MSVATDTTNHENVLTQKKGNHKGCPYDGLAGGYFQRNPSCRSMPAHRGMKMGAGSYVGNCRKATSGDGFPPSRE